MKTLISGFLLLTTAICGAAQHGLETRAQVESEVHRLLQAREFSKLDALAKELRDTNAVTLSGYSLLHMFHQSLRMEMETDLDDQTVWNALETLAKTWVKESPKSPMGNVMVAEVRISRAWQIRGTGYASTVSPQQWMKFNELVQSAKDYLLQTRKYSEVDPWWYERMLRIAIWQSKPEIEFRTLLDQALATHPTYFGVHMAAVDYYSPKWGGSLLKIEEISQRVTSKLPVAIRDTTYARLYSYVYQEYMRDNSEARVNCPQWIRGSEDIVKLHPTQYNYNLAAIAATKCSNRSVARKYFQLIGDTPNLSLWRDRAGAAAAFARARAWSKAGD